MPTPREILKTAYYPALPVIKVQDSAPARLLMLAIGLQESRFTHRRQMGNGPARGFWQFEQGGGVKGVLTHTSSRARAEALCAARTVPATAADVHKAIEYDDVLAAGFARLLLLTDPRPLPEVGDMEGAWNTYIWNWRPGKPHPETWPALYHQAMEALL
jgi:hypothetical protein